MKKPLVSILLCFISGLIQVLYAAPGKQVPLSCEQQKVYLSASYLVTEQETGKTKRRQQTVNLYRLSDTIIYRYPERAISEIWHQTSNQKLKPIHLFDRFKKGIEYQTSDFDQKDASDRWQNKFQLLSDSFLSRLIPETDSNHSTQSIMVVNQPSSLTSRSECDQFQYLQGTLDGVQTRVVWLKDAALPVSIEIHGDKTIQHWQLRSLRYTPEENKNLYQQLTSYQLTDYADIGDNESDPFLSKMIELGFVQHGQHGFYRVDANGFRVDEGHHESGHEHEDHPLH